jgi:hypothetical protein
MEVFSKPLEGNRQCMLLFASYESMRIYSFFFFFVFFFFFRFGVNYYLIFFFLEYNIIKNENYV